VYLQRVVSDPLYVLTTTTGRDARIKPAELQIVVTHSWWFRHTGNFKLSNPHKLFLTNNFKGGAIASVFRVLDQLKARPGSINDNPYPFPKAKKPACRQMKELKFLSTWDDSMDF